MAKSPVQLGFLVWLAVVSGAVLAADAQKDKRTLEKAKEWEKAAQNRERAAITQQAQAEYLLEQAQELRKKEYLYETQRRKNLKKAGDAEKRAGDLEGVACVNFDRTAANWDRVAKEYKTLDDAKKQKNAEAFAKLARECALLACGKAADAYELAAEAYGKDNANEPHREAGASEGAAAWREKLAGRK